MGFPGYFLIVADFIQWAKDNDVPVGPGRGSGAGSLVAYGKLSEKIGSGAVLFNGQQIVNSLIVLGILLPIFDMNSLVK